MEGQGGRRGAGYIEATESEEGRIYWGSESPLFL